MTTMTDTEQQRSEFEALEKTRFGYGKDTLVRYPTDEDEYYMPLTQARWEGYQAGRAALQSQDRKPCTWEHDAEIDAYETTCGNTFIVGEGTPAENDMKFCCYCGGALIEAIDHARRIEGEGE